MKRIISVTAACLLVLVVAVLFFYRGAIFQRGNPLPYVGSNGNDKTQPSAADSTIRYEMYELDGIVVGYPSHWIIEIGNQEDHVLFYETKPSPNPTGGPTYYTQLYCWVLPLDNHGYPKNATERLDSASTMNAPLIEHEIKDMGEAEAALTTYARPDKPVFHHTEIYIYYNDKVYMFSFFCDTTNENDVEIINEMINSISIK